MTQKQTIYLAAPGFQSVDNWMPIAYEQFKSDNENVILLFPYFWVLELIPQNDLLVRMIRELQIPVSLPLFGSKRFLLFRSIDDARTYILLSRTIRNIVDRRLSLNKSSITELIRQLSTLATSCSVLVKLRFLRFQKRGVMVWDLLNIQSEPAEQLRNVSIRTVKWRRISINVSPIYAERPTLEGKRATANDYAISFSEEQSNLLRKQYAIDQTKIYKTPVPRHSTSWIQFLQRFSLSQICIDMKFVLLVSRGADPPLLTYEEKMLIFSTIVKQICGVNKLKLLVKLHPNENQESFHKDLEFIKLKYGLGESLLRNVSLTHEHILVIAAQAEFGIAYFSGTIADMVRVGCPAVQFLPFNDHDGNELEAEKLLLDKGMAEMVKSIDAFAPTVDQIIDNRAKKLSDQKLAYDRYFYSGESSLLPFTIDSVSM